MHPPDHNLNKFLKAEGNLHLIRVRFLPSVIVKLNSHQ